MNALFTLRPRLATGALLRTCPAPPATAGVGAVRNLAFVPTSAARSAVKPGSESEQSIPGTGSTEEIANSQGAYDADKPNPEQSGEKISNETGNSVDMSGSAASSKPAEHATSENEREQTASKTGSNPGASQSSMGASRARKEGGRGGSGAPGS